MKKTLLLITICFIGISTALAQKQIYESPKLKDAIKTHKTVAILPFLVTIKYKKLPKDYSPEDNKLKELQYGKSIQSSMFTYLLRKADNYTVTFQDVEKTNALLTKYKMIDSLGAHTKDEVAKILGVDAVIFGTYTTATTRSEGGAIATTILFGTWASKTGDNDLTLQIANGADGDLLWRYSKRMDESLFASTDDVIERQMRKLSRNFPYVK